MAFSNPITGGQGALVRPAIKSPNYVPNVSGWSINKDGSAEFNDIVIRGGTVVSGTALYYNGTPAFGNLIFSIAATAGTDSFGNAYQAGMTSYSALGTININGPTATWLQISGSEIDISVGGAAALMEMAPGTVSGVTWDSGTFGANTDANFGANTPFTFVTSPRAQPNLARAQIQLHGASPSTNDSDIVYTSNLHRFLGNVDMRDQITSYDNNTFTSFTPTLTNTGGITYAAQNGWWQRVGKMIFYGGYILTSSNGSGAALVGLPAPTNIERTGRQTLFINGDNITGFSGALSALALSAAEGFSGSTFERIRSSTGTNLTGATLISGSRLTFNGWYREA